ncbi:unnamed protein product, partial [Prorocentrum cordatum]
HMDKRRCFAPCTSKPGKTCPPTLPRICAACSTPPLSGERLIFWQAWYWQPFAEGLVQNGERVAAKGITKATLLARHCRRGDIERDSAMPKAHFQHEAAKLNLPHSLGCWDARLAYKLRRWRQGESRHTLVQRQRESLERLGRLVAPRVAAAAWGLAWNRWCTARRFQGARACVPGLAL